MSLKATVQNLRNRAEDAKLSRADRDRFIDEWRRDVAEVYADVRSALSQVIDQDAMTFSTEPMTIIEEDLGEYTIDRVIITIVDRPIHVEPVARMTIEGTGRIDMYRHDRPLEDNRIFIVRGATEVDHAPDVWLIESKRTLMEQIALEFFPRGRRRYFHLSPDHVQDAVDFLLKLA